MLKSFIVVALFAFKVQSVFQTVSEEKLFHYGMGRKLKEQKAFRNFKVSQINHNLELI